MQTSKPSLLIVGAVPPPFNGPNMATAKLIKAHNMCSAFRVLFLDISDHRDLKNLGRFDLKNVYLGVRHIIRFLVLVCSERPGIVYLGISQGVWGYLRDLGFILPAIIMRRKLVIHLRGSQFKELFNSLSPILSYITKFALRRTSRVIVLGKSLQRCFAGLVEQNRITVIPNGINFGQFDVDDNLQLETRTGKRVLFLSTLMERKGIFLLLQALPLVLKRHPEVDLTVAGIWRNDEDKERGLTLLEANGIARQVRFVGEVSGLQKIRLYKNHDIFAFAPIQPEGLPWVILEAMSAGLPVITTDQGAISEIVEDQETGFIIKPEPVVLADTICHLIENPDIAMRMGAAGRRRIEANFSEQTYLNSLERLFQEVLAEPSPVQSGQLATAPGQPKF